MTVTEIGVRLERAPRRLTARQARAELDALRAAFPRNSKIAVMTPDDEKEELSKRD